MEESGGGNTLSGCGGGSAGIYSLTVLVYGREMHQVLLGFLLMTGGCLPMQPAQGDVILLSCYTSGPLILTCSVSAELATLQLLATR